MIGVRFPTGLGIFLLDTMSTPALGPNQLPIQLIPAAIPLQIKKPGRETHHSLPSSAEVKEFVGLYLYSHYVFMAWCLVKDRDSFTFIFYYYFLTLKFKYCAHKFLFRHPQFILFSKVGNQILHVCKAIGNIAFF
jgi:hypothetical protein